jgi:hypothetical protein
MPIGPVFLLIERYITQSVRLLLASSSNLF